MFCVCFELQLTLEAQRSPGSDVEPTAWIAARYEASSLPDEMLLGDGSWPGSADHFNRPLPNFLPYRVFLRAVTVTNVSSTAESDWAYFRGYAISSS